MKTVLFLSVVLLTLFFNIGTVTSLPFRIIVDKLPMLPESNATKDGIIVQNSTECQTYCKGSRNYLFAAGKGGLRCLCSNESNPFRYGLVSSPGALFKSEVRDVTGIDYFIYMGIKPVDTSELLVKDIDKVISLDTCALLCYNYRPIDCVAFSYDVDTTTAQACRLFAKPNQGTGYEVMDQNSTVMYFEYGGQFLTKFSRQWGLPATTSAYKVKKPNESKQQDLYSMQNLFICASQCYTNFKSICEDLYYDIENEVCYINELPEEDRNTSSFNPNFLHFRQGETEDCSAIPLPTSIEAGMFRSPGFPYSYAKKPCSWKFLTPWGKALSVKLFNSLPKLDDCQETIQINNAGGRICQVEKQIVGQSNNGLNTVELIPSKTQSDGIAFVAKYESVWACRPGGEQLVLQGPGGIATTHFPDQMPSSVCRWKISAGPEEGKPVSINIRDLDFKSDPMMESATLKFSDGKNSVLCNSTNACKGQIYNFSSPVEIEFQSGMYHINPKGFQLTYDVTPEFPESELKDTKESYLDNKMQVIREAEMGLQNKLEVNLTYTIINRITDSRFQRISLTLGTILLGETHTTSNITYCSNGYMQIKDPAIDASKYTYLFCNHKDNGTRIISNGNTLIVNVVIPPQSHLASTLPPKNFNYSATYFQDFEYTAIELNGTQTFTSPNYPGKYPPKQMMAWYIMNMDGKLAVLSFLDVKLGRYRVLTNYFCNNDHLLVEAEDNVKYLSCNITGAELPMRFVQHEILVVMLFTTEQYLGSGFNANLQYYDTIGCNATMEPVTIKSVGPMIHVRYDASNPSPCVWYVDVDVVIDCLEGCSQVTFIEPFSRIENFQSDYTIVDRGSTIHWIGNERVNWFTALVLENIPTTTSTTSTIKPVTQNRTTRITPLPPIINSSTSRPPIINSSSTTQVIFNGTSTSAGGVVAPSNQDGSLSPGAIVGIIIGVLLFVAIVIVLTLLLLRRTPYDVDIVNRMRNSFANVKNPFTTRTNETETSPYKSFVDEDTLNSRKKEEIAIKYNKNSNGDFVQQNPAYEANDEDYNVIPGHIQIGGLEDTNMDEA